MPVRSRQSLGVFLIEFQHRLCAFQALLDFLDMFGGREVFGRRAANALDGGADFLADVQVGVDGALFAADAFALEFVAGLGHAELIGGEFGGIHAVHELFFVGDSLVFLDRLDAETAVESFVSGVVEDAEHAALYSGVLGDPGQGLELFGGLFAQFEAFEVGGVRVGHLLTAGLNGEVLLGVGDFRLARIAVLRDEVAGEAG